MAQNINYGDTRLATLGDVRSYVSSFSEALSILAEAFSTHKASLMTTTKLGHARLGTATNLGEGAGMVGMAGNNALAVVPASTTHSGAVKLTPAVYESMQAAVPTSAQVVDYVGNQVTQATKEIVTQSYETSTSTQNLIYAWAQLAASHIQGGELVSIDLPCRGTSGSITTTPIYLAVWQADANGTYVYLGHSDNAITQQIGTTGTFRFSNIHLAASRTVRLCATPNQGTAWHTATIMGGRGSSATDGSVVFYNGRQLQCLLRCTLYYKTGEKQRFGELANENTWAATNTFHALANFAPVSADDAFRAIHIGAADSSDLGYDIWYRKSDGALMLKRGGSDVSIFSCNASGMMYCLRGLYVQGSFTCDDASTFKQSATFSNDIMVGRHAYVAGNLMATTGDTTLKDTYIVGNLKVTTGDTTLGATSVRGTLSCDSLDVQHKVAALQVHGLAVDSLLVSSNARVEESLNVRKNLTVLHDLEVGSDSNSSAEFYGSLVANDIMSKGNIHAGNPDCGGHYGHVYCGDLTAELTSTFEGAATFQSGVTMSNTLTVAENAVFQKNIIAKDTLASYRCLRLFPSDTDAANYVEFGTLQRPVPMYVSAVYAGQYNVNTRATLTIGKSNNSVDMTGAQNVRLPDGNTYAGTATEANKVLTQATGDDRYMRFQELTPTEYEALTTKDPKVIYIVKDPETNTTTIAIGDSPLN